MPDVRTVGDLIDYLSTQPRDHVVVMAKDPEGNGHSPLAFSAEGMYVADSTWSGQVYDTPEQLAENIREYPETWSENDAAPDDAVRAVVLWPVN